MSKKTVTYPGKTVDVLWDGGLCIHIGECGRAKGDLFIGGRKPWCVPDVADEAEIVDVISRCPSGALSCHAQDGVDLEPVRPQNSVHVTPDGPLYAWGQLAIENAPADAPGLAHRAALCRCGQSRNKPFCDNSHRKADFTDSGAIGERGTPLENAGGALAIAPQTDGPLVIKGNLTMTAGSGRPAWQGTRAVLCRCGASDNKPFCDGSHKKVGFKSA